MDARAEGGDHCLDLFISVDPVFTSLFYIQDLAAQRKDRLRRAGPRRLRAAACGIALDEEDLAVLRILVRAVREFAGQGHRLERGLSSRQVARLPRGFSCSLREDRLLEDDLRDVGILLQEVGELLRHYAVRRASRLDIAELLLRLSLELRILDLDADDRRHAFADIFAGQILFRIFQKLVLSCVIIERLRQRVVEAGQVHTAFGRVDVVDEAVFARAVRIIVLQRDFDVDVVLRAFKIQNLVVQSGLAAIQVGDELRDAALVIKGLFPGLMIFVIALIFQRDAKALRQERHFPETLLQDVVIKYRRLLEDLRIRKERDARSALTVSACPDLLQGLHAGAAHEFLAVHLAAGPDSDFQPGGEGVDDRCADAVQAAGYLVPAAAEFAARMQNSEDDFHGILAGLVVDADRNAASVVRDRHRIVRVDRHFDVVAEARERLIHRVVHDLVHEVVQASRGRRADVHAGALPDRLQAFQDLDIVRGVVPDLLCILDVMILRSILKSPIHVLHLLNLVELLVRLAARLLLLRFILLRSL